MTALLALKEIVKDYGNTRALDRVSVSIKEGKIYGLVGENGAGKSTLAKIVSGGVRPDSGDIYYQGQKYSDLTPTKARDLEIAIVHQEGNLAPNLSIVDNIFLGNEIKGPGGILAQEAMNKKARQILERFGINIEIDRPVEKLSPTYQQIIAIGKALSLKSRLLIVDEGGASLDREELNQLFTVLKSLRASGVTIIYISHLLDNVLNLCDEIIILRNGKLINILESSETTVAQLASLVVGREIKAVQKKNRPAKPNNQAVRIRIDSLGCNNQEERYSFSVGRGEILGFTGPAGCGKTELLGSIFGLASRQSGTIYLDNKIIKNNSPLNMIKEGVAFVPEERYYDGLVMLRSIEENITLPSLRKWFSFLVNQSKLNHISNRAADMALTKRASLQLTPTSLSGGNQQKISIAKWLTGEYQYYLLNEPYKGIDIGAKIDISKVLRDLSNQGCALIVAATEFSDLIGLVDRLYVMVNHKIVAELKDDEITNQKIMEYYQSVLS